VANVHFAHLALAVACTLLCVQAAAQTLRDPQPDFRSPFVGNALTCAQPQKLVISQRFAKRAKLKARLYNLLRESLYDDAKGVVNMAREKEIRHLASELNKDERFSPTLAQNP